mgnify:CR=1 FL=1
MTDTGPCATCRRHQNRADGSTWCGKDRTPVEIPDPNTPRAGCWAPVREPLPPRRRRPAGRTPQTISDIIRGDWD